MMNDNTSRALIRSALILCSTTLPRYESLDTYTVSFLEERGYSVKMGRVADIMDKYCRGAKLYGAYRNKISCVQNLAWIQELYRVLWVYSLVAHYYEDLTPATLLSLVNNKYEEELLYDEYLDRNKYGCFKQIDKEFFSNEILKAGGKVLAAFTEDFKLALKKVTETFNRLPDYKYMAELYGVNTLSVVKGIRTKRQVISDSSREPEIKERAVGTSVFIRESVKPQRDNTPSKIELQLRDEIRILKNDKHDLEVKLSYAKKDAIREFVSTLMGYGWNCPLGELYRVLKEENTPEEIRGTIINLFNALGSEKIEVSCDKVGEFVVLSEDNQTSYDPFKNEKLYIGEKAEIYYPGFRYGKEIMVRPVVKKIQEKETELSNENG